MLQHLPLEGGAWIGLARNWLSGDGVLFDALEAGMPWQHTKQVLYDRQVDTPRLLASCEDGGGAGRWPVIGAMGAALSRRYRVTFDRITLALYRDGQDSVAWHRDRNLRDLPVGIVATVSLGQPRPFLLRQRGGEARLRFQLGWGDLLVMGGSCQRTWEHAVPKLRQAPGPRISIMFRHSERMSRAQAAAIVEPAARLEDGGSAVGLTGPPTLPERARSQP